MIRKFKAIEEISLFGEVLIEKDEIISVSNEKGYTLTNDKLSLNKTLSISDVSNDNRFLEISTPELNFKIGEITEEEDNEERMFTIQLEVKSTKRKMREIEKFMRKTLEEML